MGKRKKREFKPNRITYNTVQNTPPDNGSDSPRTRRISRVIYALYISLGVFVSIYLPLIGENMLNSIIPNMGFIAPMIVISIWAGLGIWLLIGRLTTWRLFKIPIIRVLLSVVLVIVAIWLSMPLYVDYLPQKEAIEFERPYYDSTQVTVYYGIRENDFFWTQKTIGELKQKSSVALNVNGEDMLIIHTDGRQVLVDAKLFAGYEERIVPSYTTIGSLANFSIQISGYLVTDNSAVGKSFSLKTQPTVIKNKALAPPVTITDNAFDREPKGWEIRRSSMGYEVINEKNIPVLVLKYESPYKITISGLFLTSFGILKVDNSNDVIFEFGDSPFELRTYTVDRIKPNSVFDIFKPERIYNLSEIYGGGK